METVAAHINSAITPARKRRFKIPSEWIWGYAFIAPLTIGILLFFIGPIFYSFFMSLMKWDILTPPQFIGLQNYRELFNDPQILLEFRNTLYLGIGTVPLTLILSVLLADALNQKIRGAIIYRTIYFLPMVTMATAVGMVWKWLFSAKVGLINTILGFFHLPQPMWVGDPHFVMPAVIIVSIWSRLGYNMVILLAGLQEIPEALYESAEIDGASKWVQFFHITLPLLTPSLFFLLVTSLIGAFQAFDMIFIFASDFSGGFGGPVLDALRTMVYGIYERGFSLLEMGYASAEAVILFVIIMGVTVIQFWVQKRWVHYDK